MNPKRRLIKLFQIRIRIPRLGTLSIEYKNTNDEVNQIDEGSELAIDCFPVVLQMLFLDLSKTYGLFRSRNGTLYENKDQ